MKSTYQICVVPGDGIGQEVIPQAVRVLEAVSRTHDFSFEFIEQPWGSDYYARHGTMMPAGAHEIVASTNATLFGAVGSLSVPDTLSAWGLILTLRRQLNLFVNLRPIRAFPPSPSQTEWSHQKPFKFLIIRENTEGEYSGIGGRIHEGTSYESASGLAVFTRPGIERIVDYAFQRVTAGGLLTSVTKSNALPHTMGLWDDVAEEVAARYPGVTWERMHVDAVAYQMVRAPERFDVVVASNLFGDILSDLGAGLQGTLGLAASGNLNPVRGVGVFEPIHGSAPDIAGKALANPLGAIESAAMMMDFLHQDEAAAAVRNAVDLTITGGNVTPDLGGTRNTSEVADAVIAHLEAYPIESVPNGE